MPGAPRTGLKHPIDPKTNSITKFEAIMSDPNPDHYPPNEVLSLDPASPKGWHSRRYMPHFDSDQLVQHVTFHLADSFPASALERIERELDLTDPNKRDTEKRKRLEALLDAGHGDCALGVLAIARLMQDSLLAFDGARYRLIAWVVMPNHVHALFQTIAPWKMGKIVASWKAFTGRRIEEMTRATRANAESTTQVWHREYWDRFIRDETHLAAAIRYIHNNPVKAGLVANAADWRWSSAWGAPPGNASLRPGV